MKANISAVPTALIPDIWDVVEPYLAKSLKNDFFLDTAIIKQRLIEDKSLLFLATLDGAISGAFVVEIWEAKHRFVNIVALGGKKFKMWDGALSDALETYAKSHGCEKIVTNGRLAWTRLFPKLKPINTCFSWEVQRA